MMFQSKITLVWIIVVFSTLDRLFFSFATRPESSTCSTKRCYGKHLTCPEDCPSRRTVGPSKSACFIDCWTQCKAVCKQRTPACNGYGAVCYDPRFVGGDGVMFYFQGRKDQNFCIVSDDKIHINAHFIGKRSAGRPRDYTWVQSLGILFESHALIVGATKAAIWDDSQDHFDIKFNGRDIYLPQMEGALWASTSADVVVERMSTYNVVHVVIQNLIEIIVSVVPISEHESFMHNYEISEDDCFTHLQMQFYFLELSNSVNGVLGQTYQSGYRTPVNSTVGMPVMGQEDKYLSTSLLKADCKVNQFRPPPVHDTEMVDMGPLDIEPFDLFKVRCKSSDLEGLNCRR